MPHAWEQAIIEFLSNLFQIIDWAGVVVIMALESANIPIPSEVTMPLAGWLLVQDQGGTWLEALLLGGLWGAVGCTIGSVLSYALGYYGGRPLVEKYGKYIMVNTHDLETADKWFNRWGDWTAFLSRLLPIVRTFISFPAGVTRIRFWSFTTLTFIGSFIWCAALALGGWYFGSRWEELRAIMRPFDIPIAIVLLAGFAYYVYRHVTHGMRHREQEPVEVEVEVEVK
ncbi:MAG TPA: DedA family protein [Chloroflexi bacterium]|nr:DedA family protein [Chloroflexota bacterium]